MSYKQIYDEYLDTMTDFARKLREIDEKHGTYVKCSIVDVPILQVGSSGIMRYSRSISFDEIMMASEARAEVREHSGV